MSDVSADRLVAKYYRLPDGSEPVRDFIATLPAATQVSIDNFIDRINALCTLKTPDLKFPNSSHIAGPIYELRPQAGGDKYRILYARSDRMVVLLHIFRKSTKATPAADKAIANERWADFQVRMNEDPRRPPSPLGTGRAPK